MVSEFDIVVQIILISLIISVSVIVLIKVFLILMSRKIRRLKRFPPIPLSTEAFTRKIFKIPMSDGRELIGYQYDPVKIDWSGITIIVLHGFTDTALNPNDVEIASSLATLGHKVIAYDIRDHGNSTIKKFAHFEPDYFSRAMIKDSEEVLEFVKNLPEVDRKKLALIGFSYGGIIALSGMVHDPDLRFICAGCALYDYNEQWKYHLKNSSWLFRFSLKQVFFHKQRIEDFYDTFQAVSPKIHAETLFGSTEVNEQKARQKKIYLLHCKDDPLVIFDLNFHKLREVFKVPEDNTLVFEDGGHAFEGHHEEILEFFKKCIIENFY